MRSRFSLLEETIRELLRLSVWISTRSVGEGAWPGKLRACMRAAKTPSRVTATLAASLCLRGKTVRANDGLSSLRSSFFSRASMVSLSSRPAETMRALTRASGRMTGF